VVAMLVPWQELNQPFATSIAFERAFGWPWLVQLIMIGAALSLFKVFNGSLLSATRMFYALAQRKLIPAKLGGIHPHWQNPTAAVLLVGAITALASLLGPAVIVPISELGSLIVLGWLATCLALCAGAGSKRTAADLVVGVVGAGVSLVLGVIVVWSFDW